jgi:hypothetical protein
MVLVERKFKPPRRSAFQQWKAVEYLVKNGFRYQSIFENGKNVSYPRTLAGAKTFVTKYKDRL